MTRSFTRGFANGRGAMAFPGSGVPRRSTRAHPPLTPRRAPAREHNREIHRDSLLAQNQPSLKRSEGPS